MKSEVYKRYRSTKLELTAEVVNPDFKRFLNENPRNIKENERNKKERKNVASYFPGAC